KRQLCRRRRCSNRREIRTSQKGARRGERRGAHGRVCPLDYAPTRRQQVLGEASRQVEGAGRKTSFRYEEKYRLCRSRRCVNRCPAQTKRVEVTSGKRVAEKAVDSCRRRDATGRSRGP